MSQERDEQAAHEAAMQIVDTAVTAFKRGQMSFHRAKQLIDDAMLLDHRRIVSPGHTPEIQT